MSQKLSTSGCFKYAYLVFILEFALALFWFIVLIYMSIEDHEKIVMGLLFGLHYPGLIALSGLMDDILEKKKVTQRELNKAISNIIFDKNKYNNSTSLLSTKQKLSKNQVYSVISAHGNQKTINDGINENGREFINILGEDDLNENEKDLYTNNELTSKSEKEFSKKIERYPLEYGVALFVSMITDLFSLVDVMLSHKHHTLHLVSYYLYAVLFGTGLFLTISSIIWSFVFYRRARDVANMNTY